MYLEAGPWTVYGLRPTCYEGLYRTNDHERDARCSDPDSCSTRAAGRGATLASTSPPLLAYSWPTPASCSSSNLPLSRPGVPCKGDACCAAETQVEKRRHPDSPQAHTLPPQRSLLSRSIPARPPRPVAANGQIVRQFHRRGSLGRPLHGGAPLPTPPTATGATSTGAAAGLALPTAGEVRAMITCRSDGGRAPAGTFASHATTAARWPPRCRPRRNRRKALALRCGCQRRVLSRAT